MMPDAVVTLWHFSVATEQPLLRQHAAVPATIEAVALKYLRALWPDPPQLKHHGAWVVDGVRYHCRPRVDRIITWWTA